MLYALLAKRISAESRLGATKTFSRAGHVTDE